MSTGGFTQKRPLGFGGFLPGKWKSSRFEADGTYREQGGDLLNRRLGMLLFFQQRWVNIFKSFSLCTQPTLGFHLWQVLLRVCLCYGWRIMFFFYVLTTTSLWWSFLRLLVILLIPYRASDRSWFSSIPLKPWIFANRTGRSVSKRSYLCCMYLLAILE